MKRGVGGTIRLDRLDLKILATLQTAGRISNLELADKVGLSATPCLQRVRRMETAGYISGYAARLEIDRICSNIVVFTEITLRGHRREDFLKFERGIQEIPQLLNCFLVTGGYDYRRSSSPRTSTTIRPPSRACSTATLASTSTSATSPSSRSSAASAFRWPTWSRSLIRKVVECLLRLPASQATQRFRNPPMSS
jgi:hypothetical protein